MEGDTARGLFELWFEQLKVAADQPAEGLNLELVAVGGDSAFGTFVAYLDALRIPWAIIGDGLVLSRAYGRNAVLGREEGGSHATRRSTQQTTWAASGRTNTLPRRNPADNS